MEGLKATTSISLDKVIGPHALSDRHGRIPRPILMEHTGDIIAEAVQKKLESLPQKRKPQSRGSGVREWVPLSGVVAEGTFPCLSFQTL